MNATQRGSRGWSLAALALATLGLLAPQAHCGAEGGVFVGRVIDDRTGEGVGGARVAVLDSHGHVAAWATTRDDGGYTLPARTAVLLGLQPPSHHSIVGNVLRGLGTVASAPFRVVGASLSIARGAVGALDPARTVAAAATSAALGNPAPFGAQIVSGALGSMRGRARDRAIRVALGRREDTLRQERGQARLVVSAPQYQTAQGTARAVWLQPSDQERAGLWAWLPSVHLSAASDRRDPSYIGDEGVRLAEPAVSPGLALPGETLTVQVALRVPQDQPLPVRVFVREAHAHTTAELFPEDGGLYAGTLPLNPKVHSGDTALTIVALRTHPLADTGHDRDPDPVASLAAHTDALNEDKDYAGDPLLFAGANRLVVPFTVLKQRR